MEKYGPLAPWVIYGSNLVAAVWAIRVAALGHALWEPNVEGFPRAPVRIAGIGAILLLAVTFALSRKHTEIEFWIPWTLWIFAPLFIFFIADIFLRQWLIVKCASANPIFGGIWLTSRAKAILQGAPRAYTNRDLVEGDTPPPSAAALYCSFPAVRRDKTRVWPPASTATASAVIVVVYCLWNILSITGFVLAATLIVIAVGST
jgi:hypothetical protein